MMKKLMILGIVLCLLMTAGCGAGSSGPDEGALPPLETAPPATGGSQNYDRSDPIVIYQENLNCGVSFELYEDGRLLLTGADMTASLGDEKAYQDYKDSITTIELGEGITVVDNKAFAGLENIQKVIVGETVTSIGYSAFSDCKALTQVDFGDNLKQIGDYAFSGCAGKIHMLF